jgi:hypothetical protein
MRLWIGLLFLSGSAIFSWSVDVHQNLPEESVLYMEFQGTNQMRWAADYVKAKAGGRYTGTCVNINYTPDEMGRGNNTQCGAIGIHRVGGDKIDFIQDNFFDHPLFYSWKAPLLGNNLTSYTHFINLKKTDSNGDPLVTNNYNTIDGYSYNGTYGFQEFGSLDSLIATVLGASVVTINIGGCTDSACSEWVSAATGMNTNPIVDYMQNGSTTPLGTPRGPKQLGSDDGTNYNCHSDTAVLAPCPDKGVEMGGTYQVPNVIPGGASGNAISFFTGNEDWVIWEPAYNAATFYYNEAWLEGLNSRNHSLETGAIVGRYYTVTGDQVLYYTLTHHYMGDMTQMSHVWVSTGYNHTDIEGYNEDHYGKRQVGGSNPTQNFEDYANSQAYANSRQNRYTTPVGNIPKLILEQTFITYHIRFRSGYDKMTTSNQSVWENFTRYAMQNGATSMALVNEKAVMDLRKCRNSGTCNNL